MNVIWWSNASNESFYGLTALHPTYVNDAYYPDKS